MRNDSDFMNRISLDLAARKAACKILNVEEDANKRQLRSAYRVAAIRYHPDHNRSTAEANRMFTLIKCAYELLAFGKPCDALLVETEWWHDVPQGDKYKLDHPWGHFCWWREKFLGTDERRGGDDNTSCV